MAPAALMTNIRKSFDARERRRCAQIAALSPRCGPFWRPRRQPLPPVWRLELGQQHQTAAAADVFRVVWSLHRAAAAEVTAGRAALTMEQRIHGSCCFRHGPPNSTAAAPRPASQPATDRRCQTAAQAHLESAARPYRTHRARNVSQRPLPAAVAVAGPSGGVPLPRSLPTAHRGAAAPLVQ